jgi:primosomal replication protein N''
MDLSHLQSVIESLEKQAMALDEQRGEHHAPLFDPILFHCKAHSLVPCVSELKETYCEIIKTQKQGRLTPEQATYLTERLMNQLVAIQREFSTSALRRTETHHSVRSGVSLNALYQELAQHQDWERQLQNMIFDQSAQLESNELSFTQKSLCQRKLLTLEQRLSRCQQAKQQLENKISAKERKNY